MKVFSHMRFRHTNMFLVRVCHSYWARCNTENDRHIEEKRRVKVMNVLWVIMACSNFLTTLRPPRTHKTRGFPGTSAPQTRRSIWCAIQTPLGPRLQQSVVRAMNYGYELIVFSFGKSCSFQLVQLMVSSRCLIWSPPSHYSVIFHVTFS